MPDVAELYIGLPDLPFSYKLLDTLVQVQAAFYPYQYQTPQLHPILSDDNIRNQGKIRLLSAAEQLYRTIQKNAIGTGDGKGKKFELLYKVNSNEFIICIEGS